MFKLLLFVAMGYALDLNVFRMVGIDSGTEWVGSKIAQFSLITTHWKNSTQRKVSLIKFSELSATSINDMLSKKTGGVTVILDSVERSQEHIIWDEVYSRLGPKGQTIPIYFTYPDEAILKHYEELQSPSEFDFQLQVTSTDQKLQLQLDDYYNLLDTASNFRPNNPSTLVVLGLDQDLPSAEIPVKSIGLQHRVFFKLARFLLHHVRRDRNLIFYISTSLSIDQFGLKHFLKKPDHGRVAATVDTVVILGSLHGNQPLVIEATNPEEIRGLAAEFFGETLLTSIPADSLSHKELTILHLASESRPSILSEEREEEKAEKVFRFLVKYIAEAEVEQSYDESMFEDHLQEFLQSVNLHPVNLQKDSKFVLNLHNLLKQIFKHTVKVQYQIKDKKYHVSASIKGQIIKFYSAFIDLYLLVFVGLWLFIVYSIFRFLPVFREKSKQD